MDFSFINLLLAFFAVYSIASFSVLLSERSGSVNIGAEGNMIIGGLVFTLLMNSSTALQGVVGGPFLAMLVAGIATMLYSTLFSLATINFMGDHVIVGTAMNMIAPAISLLVLVSMFNKTSVDIMPAYFVWTGTPAGEIANSTNSFNITALLSALFGIIILVGGWFFLKRTSWGLRLKTSGENPYALETSGVSVVKTRWIVNTVVGFFSGFAGAISMITFSFFSGTVGGMGYIAIAILIIGQWRIEGIALGALVMSLAFAIFNTFTVSNPKSEIYQIIPFILPLVILVFVKLSSEKKFSLRLYENIHKTPKNIVKEENYKFLGMNLNSKFALYSYYATWYWIAYTLFYLFQGIPILIALSRDKMQKYKEDLLEKPSVFSHSSSPATLGKSFKKDLR